MAFIGRGTLNPHGAPVLSSQVITNSITVTEMDSVKLSSGFIALGTAAALVFGHATGIATNKGVGLETSGAAGAEIGSFAGAYLTASTNQTVAKVRAVCDVSKFSIYSALLSAAVGTTTGSNLAGYKLNLSDSATLDETSALATTLQYNSFGLDPKDATRIMVNIYQSQVFGV